MFVSFFPTVLVGHDLHDAPPFEHEYDGIFQLLFVFCFSQQARHALRVQLVLDDERFLFNSIVIDYLWCRSNNSSFVLFVES